MKQADKPTEHIVRVRDETVTFAVITLLLYIFLYPVGLLLNVVGLMTGPKRGCFVQMFIVFVVIPIMALVILMAMGFDIIDSVLDMLG